MPFVEAIKVGGQMVMLLEKLHALNYIHGDAHYGNFCVHHDKVVLIDFGRARIIDARTLREGPKLMNAFEQRIWYSIYLTPWEMQRYTASFRDDVYRVLQGVAILLNGFAYFQLLDFMVSTELACDKEQPLKKRFLEMKRKGAIFEIPLVPNDKTIYPGHFPRYFKLEGKMEDEIVPAVREKLNALMTALVAVPIARKPNYRGILQAFEDILKLVEGVEHATLEAAFHANFPPSLS